MAFDKLFKPIEIGSVDLKNRYALAPATFISQNFNGLVSEQDIAYCIARAKGGVGLVDFGAVPACRIGIPLLPHPHVNCTGWEHVAGLANLAESVHLCNSKVFIQLMMSPGGHTHVMTGESSLGPTAGIPFPRVIGTNKGGFPSIDKVLQNFSKDGYFAKELLGQFQEPRELTTEQIERDIVAEIARNAKFAVLAGFDGIELHLCHGYFVDSFRDPRLNKRTDKYGGSLMNRNRLLLELTEATIKSCREEKSDFVVGVRVGCEQAGGDGYTFEETKGLAREMEDLGINFYHVTAGDPAPPDELFVNPKAANGTLLKYSRELKQILNVPVITPMIHDPKLAEQAVAEGWTDIVSLCRPLLADPNYVNKVKHNKVDSINRCRRDGYCMLNLILRLQGRCSVNPELGRERYNPKYQLTRGFKGSKVLPQMLRKSTKNKLISPKRKEHCG